MYTMDKMNTELENYNNEMQMAKSILFTESRTFVSGLHILAENKILESILHANVFKKKYSCNCPVSIGSFQKI